MRPVILSSPENSAPLLAIFCDGGSGMTSSPGCGEVSAGCGVPRGWRWPGGIPGSAIGPPGARGSAAAVVPSGGGKGWFCTPPAGGACRACPGYGCCCC